MDYYFPDECSVFTWYDAIIVCCNLPYDRKYIFLV